MFAMSSLGFQRQISDFANHDSFFGNIQFAGTLFGAFLKTLAIVG
jgi:hypothetical protein